MVEKVHETAGHSISSVRKQKAMDAGVQPPTAAHRPCCPHPGWIFPALLKLFGNVLIDIPRGVSMAILNPIRVHNGD